MRVIRAIFLLILAVLLVAVALANRQLVSLSLNFGSVLPKASISVPLFVVILVTLMLGLTLGLIWEWLRGISLRSEYDRRGREIARLEREVKGLRRNHGAPTDEVLAILDAPRPPPTGTVITPVGQAVVVKA